MRFLDMQERESRVQELKQYIEGVREIFRHFLPDQEFVGVRIPESFSGIPQITVRSRGVEHDINQLSSGQREILMTYTHLEKLWPTGSIILFDEPELHLHPTLQRRVIAHLRHLIERGRQIHLELVNQQ
jgi:predicted ATPase